MTEIRLHSTRYVTSCIAWRNFYGEGPPLTGVDANIMTRWKSECDVRVCCCFLRLDSRRRRNEHDGGEHQLKP